MKSRIGASWLWPVVFLFLLVGVGGCSGGGGGEASGSGGGGDAGPGGDPSGLNPTCTDADKDGYYKEGGSCGTADCNDSAVAIHPGATEICDSNDNDCDGSVDEGGVCGPTCTDADHDGYSIEGGACGTVDCDDGDGAIHPGASEVCGDGKDNDCAGGDQVCPASSPSALPDTGQTKCYDNTQEIPCPSPGQPFYGQDANYTINPLSYSNNGNGTVTDNVTGLVWQREDDNTTRTWDAAMTYCQDLGLAGSTDWRLPSKKEFMGLVNYKIPYSGPTIDTNAFQSTISWYWSSTTYAYGPSYAWVLYFSNGYVNYSGKGNNNYVRCVRGGQ